MKRSTDRILTTHVGSLIRPKEIRDAFEARAAGKTYDEDKLQQTLRREVANVVKQQADTGIDVVDDGEFGKAGWMRYVSERLNGLELRPLKPGEKMTTPDDIMRETKVFPDFYKAYNRIVFFDWLPPEESKTPLDQKPAAGGAQTMIWDCTTCYKCQEQCPQGVHVADVLYTLKNKAWRKHASRPAASAVQADG